MQYDTCTHGIPVCTRSVYAAGGARPGREELEAIRRRVVTAVISVISVFQLYLRGVFIRQFRFNIYVTT